MGRGRRLCPPQPGNHRAVGGSGPREDEPGIPVRKAQGRGRVHSPADGKRGNRMILAVEEIWADQTFSGGTALRMSVCPHQYREAVSGTPKSIFARMSNGDCQIAVAELHFVACIKQKTILEVAALHSADFALPPQALSVSLISASQQASHDRKGKRLVGEASPSSVAFPAAGEWRLPQGQRQVRLSDVQP